MDKSELLKQSWYWDREAQAFHAIYSREKSLLLKVADQVLRRDMFDRFVFTLDNCKPIGGRSFLDVGCGDGLYSAELAKKGAKKVIGIDISSNMLEIARKEARLRKLTNCKFLNSNIQDMNSRELFDVVIGIGLFDYIKDPIPTLSEMKERAKTKIILSFPRLWTWRAPVRKARLMTRGCPVYFYSLQRIKSILKITGLKKYRISKIGKLYCVVIDIK